MANLIIKPTSGGSLVLQDEGGDAAVSVGTTGDVSFGTGSNGKLFHSMQVFTASATYTKPAGVTAIMVIVTGSGGSSGVRGSGSDKASGGSAGGTAIKWITSGIGSTETVTIGPEITSANTAGTTSSFGSHCTGTGGGGGAANAVSGQPGIGTGGDINIRGGKGTRGNTDSSYVIGGASYWGGGSSQGAGSAAGHVSYGAGGGDADATGRSGVGICVVYEYKG